MAMFDFLKKKEEAPPTPDMYGPPGPPPTQEAPAPGETPTDYVINMQNQGLTPNQIIQILQRQGYSQRQIYDALNQASVKGAVETAPNFQSVPTPEAGIAPPMQGPSMSPPTPPHYSQQSPPQAPKDIEAAVESVVEEKWKEWEKKQDKEKEWKDKMDARITRLEQYVTDLKSDIDNLHRAIVSKIADYDKNLLSVGTEIKAMEKVFQKVLPTLTDSVGELSRITKDIKTADIKAQAKK